MTKFTFFVLALSLFAACLAASAAPGPATAASSAPMREHEDVAAADADDTDNNLFAYEPMLVSKVVATARANSNKIKPASSLTKEDLERESSSSSVSNNNAKVSAVAGGSGYQSPPVVPDSAASGTPNSDAIKSIAFNSREVRLVGPQRREVEMRDDAATKVAVAFENLQKEAGEVWDKVNEKLDKGWTDIKRSEVWGQVNEKLDKGWTDLKTMVESVVKPKSGSGGK